MLIICWCGEIGRRKGLKIPRVEISVPVQVRPSAPKVVGKTSCHFFVFGNLNSTTLCVFSFKYVPCDVRYNGRSENVRSLFRRFAPYKSGHQHQKWWEKLPAIFFVFGNLNSITLCVFSFKYVPCDVRYNGRSENVRSLFRRFAPYKSGHQHQKWWEKLPAIFFVFGNLNSITLCVFSFKYIDMIVAHLFVTTSFHSVSEPPSASASVCRSIKNTLYLSVFFIMEATIRIELMNGSFADSCLTAWLRRQNVKILRNALFLKLNLFNHLGN